MDKKYPWHDITSCTLKYCKVCDSFFESIKDKNNEARKIQRK